ncbi:MAG TPA: anthranilate synthase component I [Bryobacteraceae bacterium]|nr:anthranilate synthase component I [Bryobacteraceae bacterium]
MAQLKYATRSGVAVTRSASKVPFKKGLRGLLHDLDRQRGIYLSSGYEYPGRYSRWDIASIAPPLEIVSFGRHIEFRPLNERGAIINQIFHRLLREHPHWEYLELENGSLRGRLKPLPALFSEEQRSKQPSVFSVLRALVDEFKTERDSKLSFVGAFGFDLLFQFDPIELKLPRGQRKDLHLFLCDDIYYMDRKKEIIERYEYDFTFDDLSTAGLPRTNPAVAPPSSEPAAPFGTSDSFLPEGVTSDHTAEEYGAKVEAIREGMARGDYYEVVLRRTFAAPFTGSVSELFERIQTASPSPYEFLLQLGDEQLIGASPEMFVRIEGSRVETCPISGTAARTGDPLKDAANIRELLMSAKEESELTMCTDVDRNDKSRVCVPGSVQVIGRRLIESYAGVFHTVDHVEGTLEPEFDSLDAFLAHMWAVTVIGAPKKAAAQTIENTEKNARGWYGGAIGMLSLNGDINTGILIRTIHLREGRAEYPVGATLLYDSVPPMEEQETRLKATGFFRVVKSFAQNERKQAAAPAAITHTERKPVRMLLIDNDDCFIHTLANYARQTGASVTTYRSGVPMSLVDELAPDVILISPGPGRPKDFGVPDLVHYAADRGVPVFGVCLGLQGVVEAFGGELGVLGYPMHGKPSLISHQSQGVFEGLPDKFQVGRYHSLFALPERLPECLEVTARSEDGVIMGVRHRELPIEAVQFHPESLLSLDESCGLKLMQNVVRIYGRVREQAGPVAVRD